MKHTVLAFYAQRFLAVKIFLLVFFIVAFQFTVSAQNNVLSFDGSNDVVNLGNISAGSSFTVEGWVCVNNTSSSQLFFGKSTNVFVWYDHNEPGIRVEFDDGSSYVGINESGGTPYPINAGTWYHIATTFGGSGTTIKLYVNGSLVTESGTINSNPQLSNDNFRLGAYNDAGDSRSLNGKLDEVRIWNVVRTQSEIQNNMYNVTLDPSTTGLVAYYHFDQGTAGGNNTGVTTLNDATNNNNNGTLNNFALSGSTSNWISSDLAQNTLAFDGIDDVVNCGNISTGNSFTVEGWVYLNNTSSDQLFFGKSSNVFVWYDHSQPGIRVEFLTSSNGYKGIPESGGSAYSISAGTWYHLAATFGGSGTTIKLYVNGTLESETSTINYNPELSTDNFRLGAWSDAGSSRPLNGKLDEVRVWDIVRTQSEIQNNMHNDNLNTSTTGLVAYYHFNQGTAGGDNSSVTTLFDATSNNHDGTLSNFALSGTTSNWVSSDVVLPVELTNFSASVTGDKVELKWETATELNNHGFDILRRSAPQNDSHSEFASANEESWAKIGFVEGYGNSNSPKSYSFTDQPTGGTSFSYRIKQIDNDGQYKYYDAITVTLDKKIQAELIGNYPNPFNPSTKIKFYLPETENVTIKIFDILGKEVKTLINKQTDSGYHIVYWNGRDSYGRDTSSGVYIYKLQAKDFVRVKKMALLK